MAIERVERIALALLTCDRYDYTERTVTTFLEHNPFLDRFILLHGDDASTDGRIRPLVAGAGFKTVVQLEERKGWLRARTALIDAASRRASWIFFLENDCETLRPFPWYLFDYVSRQENVDCLRLYGEYKSANRTGERCLPISKITRKPVRWKALKHAPEAAESAFVHWSAQPSVTRSGALRRLHYDGTDLKGRTVRVLENVTSHIGDVRTRDLK